MLKDSKRGVRFCKTCKNLAVAEIEFTFVPMKEMPGFIKVLVHALANCEDVDEHTIVSVSWQLRNSPRTASLLTSFAEIGYCNSEMVLSEFERLSRLREGLNLYLKNELRIRPAVILLH